MQVSESSNRILAGLLEARTGQQLAISRRWRIETALSGLLRERGIPDVDQLIARLVLQQEPSLAREVVEALLNNETYFFRDRAPFELLAEQLLPELARRRASSRRLSIWSAGCSTGQETLSLAMMFAEQAPRWNGWTIDIIGTDVSESAIEIARQGCYSQFQVQRGLGVMQMMRWFDETPRGWQAKPQLLRTVRFQTHNMLEPFPKPGGFDVVLCRNVLLYFSGAKRAEAFERLSAAMAMDGFLMLGVGETVVGQTPQLVPDQSFRGLYRKIAVPDAPPQASARAAAAGT